MYVFVRSSRAFNVEPFGPSIRCRLLTNLSLLRTRLRILMTSQAISSSRILTACWTGTLRERSLIRSLAARMDAGSKVFLVVRTSMRPSTRSSVHATPRFSRALVTSGHACLRYSSRYLGNRHAKEDSSANVPPALSSGLKSSIWKSQQVFRSRGLDEIYLPLVDVLGVPGLVFLMSWRHLESSSVSWYI